MRSFHLGTAAGLLENMINIIFEFLAATKGATAMALSLVVSV
jgi:hypothetical protein